MEEAIISSTSGIFGKMVAVNRPNHPAAMAPTRICPSAPMFQNFMRNASEMPMEVMSSGTAIFTVSRATVGEPQAPEIIALYTVSGLCPSRSRSSPPVISASRKAAARMPQAARGEMESRLAMRSSGSLG